jgi:hypothetical protein
MFTDCLDCAAALGRTAWSNAAKVTEEAVAAIALVLATAATTALLIHLGPLILVWLAGAPHWVLVAMLLGLWPHNA